MTSKAVESMWTRSGPAWACSYRWLRGEWVKHYKNNLLSVLQFAMAFGQVVASMYT